MANQNYDYLFSDSMENPNEIEQRLDTRVDEILNDEEIANLPKEKQGKRLINEVIGAFFSHGGVKGSNGTHYSAMDIIQSMTDIANSYNVDSSALGQQLQTLTRNEGVRDVAFKLLNDPRTAPLVGNMSHLVKSETDPASGRQYYTLTNLEQIKAFLFKGKKKEIPFSDIDRSRHLPSQQWAATLFETAQNVSLDKYQQFPTIKSAIELGGSDIEAVRLDGEKLLKSFNTAEQLGVDLELLERSVNLVQKS